MDSLRLALKNHNANLLMHNRRYLLIHLKKTGFLQNISFLMKISVAKSEDYFEAVLNKERKILLVSHP